MNRVSQKFLPFKEITLFAHWAAVDGRPQRWT